MGGSRLSLCGLTAAVIFFFAFLLNPSAIDARIRPAGFPIPSRMISLGRVVTPGEYALLRQAIKANWERDKARVLRSGPPLGSNFTHITATRIRLGSLGPALVVYFGHSPECGATGNCPMAVYVRKPKGYRRVISAGGAGFDLLPSGGPVPNIAIYGHVSAGPPAGGIFHYVHGRFAPPSGVTCTGRSTSAICTAMESHQQSLGKAISPAEYAALRPLIESNLEKQSPTPAHRSFFDTAHGVTVFHMPRATVAAVATGSCGMNRNCSISVYDHHFREGKDWPLLSNATGWGISFGAFENTHSASMRMGLVIARHLSPMQDELTRYSIPLTPAPGVGDLNLAVGSRMSADACEIVTPKSGHWPARWNAAALVAKPVSCFGTAPTGKSSVPMTDTTYVTTLVQESNGTVWGTGSAPSSRLYRWEDGGWSKVQCPIRIVTTWPGEKRYLEANHDVPQVMGLWPGPDGGALALWLNPLTNKSELVWQRGTKTKILLPLPKDAGSSGSMDILAAVSTAKGIVLITDDGGVFRLNASRELQRIYTLSPDQYLGYSGISLNFLPLHITRDGQGKVWIWCGWSRAGGPQGAALQGFLITNGKTVEYHRRIPGIPESHLVNVSVWDSHHLAAAVFGQGLYTINTTTLKAQPVPQPQPGAFRFVRKVFSAGNARYVLTFGPEKLRDDPPFERSFLTGGLWRLYDGKWKKVLANLGNTSGAGLATQKGFWLGGSQSRGLWFVPLNGPARKIGWKQGLSIANVSKLFKLPDGDVMAYGRFYRPHAIEFSPALMSAHQPGSARYSLLHTLTNVEPGLHHNLWVLLPNRVLGEWNGSRWISHPLPALIEPGRITGIDADTRGRVWLFPNCRLGPMGFFNPAADRWSVYHSYRIALEQRAHPVRFLHPADDPERPIFGPNSQIVFVGACRGINYFDGSVWRLFRGRNLLENRNIPPFFDATGHLALDIPDTTWQWTPRTSWQQTTEKPPAHYIPLPLSTNPTAKPPPPPEGCQSPYPFSLVKDSRGRSWWVADDALYEGVPGHCRMVLSGSARQPFIDGRRLVAVKIGPQGSAFLETNGPFSYIKLPRAAYAAKSLQAAAEHHSAP